MVFKKFRMVSFILMITLLSSLVLFSSCSSQAFVGSVSGDVCSVSNTVDSSCSSEVSDSFDTSFTSFASLSPKDFFRVVEFDEVIVIDIRTPEELIGLGYIAQKDLEFDFYSLEFTSQIDALDKTKRYAVYCYHDTRTGQLLSYMKEQGFTNVVDLDGGIDAWLQESLPVEFPPSNAFN